MIQLQENKEEIKTTRKGNYISMIGISLKWLSNFVKNDVKVKEIMDDEENYKIVDFVVRVKEVTKEKDE